MDQRGDLEAFISREYPRLVGALSLYCGDARVAEELAQEALGRACACWEDVQRAESPGAWVHRVALNLAASYFRRRSAERRARQRLSAQQNGEVHDVDVAYRLDVRSAVASLPSQQRKVVVLRFYLGMSVAEAAGVLRLSEPAVKSHMTRAARSLRARLAEDREVAPDG